MIEPLIASIGIFMGELYGNFVGGGSIVTQFFLQNLLNIDIKKAIALDNAAVLGSELGLFLTLLFKNRIEKWMFIPAIFGVIGSITGVYILSIIDVQILKIIFTISVIAILIYIFIPKDDSSLEYSDIKKYSTWLLGIIGLFVGMYNAFLSIGDFVVGLLLFTGIIHLKYSKALFALSFMLLFSRAVASLGYFELGYLDFHLLIPMFISAALAGVIVGSLLNKYKFDWMEKVLKSVGIILAMFLIFNLF